MRNTNGYRVAVLTASDKGFAGEREDKSGPAVCARMRQEGYEIAATALLPDDAGRISRQLRAWSEEGGIHLILTTGGTGLAPRDCTPEATLAVADKAVPGIAEAIRAGSMAITGRAMLSRAVAAVCARTLVVNLPGSPKAVQEALDILLPVLEHGLETLTGAGGDCAAPAP